MVSLNPRFNFINVYNHLLACRVTITISYFFPHLWSYSLPFTFPATPAHVFIFIFPSSATPSPLFCRLFLPLSLSILPGGLHIPPPFFHSNSSAWQLFLSISFPPTSVYCCPSPLRSPFPLSLQPSIPPMIYFFLVSMTVFLPPTIHYFPAGNTPSMSSQLISNISFHRNFHIIVSILLLFRRNISESRDQMIETTINFKKHNVSPAIVS